MPVSPMPWTKWVGSPVVGSGAAGFTAVTSHSSSRTTITEPGAPVKARVAGLGAVVFGDVELSCVPARGVVLMVTRRFLALRSEERRVGGGDGWRGWGDE